MRVRCLPPNIRVQRTRSSASPPHSPLTRGPLGATLEPTAARRRWKYVNERRYFVFVEQTSHRGTQWVVFEPYESASCTGNSSAVKTVAPNMRVQRTRPCASLRGSPLTRHLLGGSSVIAA